MSAADVAVYVRDLNGTYAGGYLLRQAEALEARLIIDGPARPNSQVAVVGPRSRPTQLLDRGLTRIAARWGSQHPGHSYLTRRAIGRLELPPVLYTMWVWNAARLLPGLSRRTERTALAVHLAGSDVTRGRRSAASRTQLLQVAEAADLMLCGSEFIRGVAVDLGVPAEKTVVHYIGVPVPETAPRFEPRNTGDPHIAVVGRLHPVKGVDRALYAFAGARDQVGGGRMSVVGDGPLRGELVALALELGVSQHVTFHGHLSPPAVRSVVLDADVVVQHNVTDDDGGEEALPGSLLEASAVGLPVVGTRSGGVPEAVVDGLTGLLVDPDDVDGMASAIASIVNAPEVASDMGRAGRDFVARAHNASLQDAVLATRLSELGASISPAPPPA